MENFDKYLGGLAPYLRLQDARSLFDKESWSAKIPCPECGYGLHATWIALVMPAEANIAF
jgi:hypothetical protein